MTQLIDLDRAHHTQVESLNTKVRIYIILEHLNIFSLCVCVCVRLLVLKRWYLI